MPTELLGWHCLTDRRLGWGDRRKPADGEWVAARLSCFIAPCVNGMHASTDPLVAFFSAPIRYRDEMPDGKYELCRVMVRDMITQYTPYNFVGRERMIISRIDLAPVLTAFMSSLKGDCGVVPLKRFERMVRAEFKRQNKRLK